LTVTLKDVTPPNITCPANTTVSANASCQGMIGSHSPTALSDNCNPSPTVTQSPSASTVLTGHNSSQLVTLTADDGNGNTSNCTLTVTLKDVTPPNITCPANTTVSANASCQGMIGSHSPTALSDNCNPSPTVTQSPSASTVLTGHNSSQLVTLTANDGNGNTSNCTLTVTLKDVTPPVPTCEGPQTIDLDANCQLLVPDLTDGASATDNCSMSFSWSQSPTSGTLLASGEGTTHTVTVTVDDGNGNSANCIVVLTGNDVIPPSMTCPSNQIKGMDEGLCRYTVVGTEFDGIASDNCGIVSKTYVLTGSETGSGSGSLGGQLWKKGTTNITWMVTDAAGLTASCTFSVEVKDLEPPQIICPANITVITEPGQCSVPASSVSLGTPTVSDNCGVKYPITNNSPSSYPVGVTTVKWTVKDSSNNVSTCNQKVTVVAYTCGTPNGVYHTDTTHESAKIAWTAGTCATGYQLRIRKELSPGVWGPWSAWGTASGPGNSHLFTGLDESSFYHYQIRSKCGTTYSINVNGWFHTTAAFGGVVNRGREEEPGQLEMLDPAVEMVPNPAQDLTVITLKGFSNFEKEVTMMGLNGRKVFSVRMKPNQNLLELDFNVLNVRTGMYLIRVNDGTKQVTGRLIIER